MKIQTFGDNPYNQNTYLYVNPELNKGVIIDAGLSKTALLNQVKATEVEIEGILLTHGHFDHIFSLAELREVTGAKVYIGALEKDLLERPELNLSTTLGEGKELSFGADRYVNEGELITFESASFKVIHTPGHTSGSVCYWDEDAQVLFAGDTLFEGSVGRTDLPTGDSGALVQSIRRQLLVLPEETKVYSGHGRATSIGKEAKDNYVLQTS